MARTTAPSPVAEGDLAPDFTLPDHTGKLIRLSDEWRQQPVVLFFYPKDETKGCTEEACAFRDAYGAFTEVGAAVFGISSDSVESHKLFVLHQRLPFALLSDTHSAIRRLYGVPKALGIIPGRVTYVIDRTGAVRKVFNSATNMAQHAREALATLRAFGATD